jgi:hypothetical protein
LALTAVPLGILLTCGQRETVLRHAGPVEGLVLALDTIRRRLGQTLLVWLLGIVASIGGGIGIVLVLLVAAIPVFILAGIAFWLTQSAVALALAGLVLGIVAVILGAGLNTFLWHYWTLGYAALRAGPTPAPTTDPAA